MSHPYFDTDEDALRFYNLYARVVIGWSRIERSIDITLSAVRAYSDRDGRAIVSWKPKLRRFQEVCENTDDAIINKPRLKRIISELAECAVTRHTLVHGYYHGFLPASDPPVAHFRAARFNPSEIEMRELHATHSDLFALLQDVQRLDFETLMLCLAVRTDRDRARRAGPRSTQSP